LDRFRKSGAERASIILSLKKRAGDSFPGFFSHLRARTPALSAFKINPVFFVARQKI
jgi:hypothetical protein